MGTGYDMSSNNYDGVPVGVVSADTASPLFGGVMRFGSSATLSGSGKSWAGGSLVSPNVLSSGVQDWSMMLYISADDWTGKRCVVMIPGTGEGSAVPKAQPHA